MSEPRYDVCSLCNATRFEGDLFPCANGESPMPHHCPEPAWMEKRAPDPVNHPAHYTAGSIEVIDYIEQVVRQYPPEVGYHIGNALKYLSRAPLKGNLKQDLAKAGWYVDRAMSALPPS